MRKLSAATRGVETLEARRLMSSIASVLQYHNDAASDGVNSNETLLNPSNVNTSDFGKNFSTAVDGQIYAQPLYDPQVSITVGGKTTVHNVVYVATEHDTLYAIDADGGTILWQDSFLNPSLPGAALPGATLITTVPSADTKSTDISPEIGITSTPVIDGSTGMLYVEAKTKQTAPAPAGSTVTTHYVQTLFEIDTKTGNVVASHVIGDTTFADGAGYDYVSGPYVVGKGDGAITVSGQSRVYFNALRALQRSALTLDNGSVYLAFASHGDNRPYVGWILGFSESNLTPTAVFSNEPNGQEGGVWQGGGEIAIDPQGFMYVGTGNGDFNTAASNFNAQGFPIDGDYGDCILKIALDPTTSQANPGINGWGLKVVDYFTPSNNASLDQADKDVGSGGIMILPDSAGSAAHPHLLVAAGKDGRVFLIDRDNMGKFDPTTDHIVQEAANDVTGSLDTPAFFNGTLFWVGSYTDPGQTFTVANATISAATSKSKDSFAFPGSTPSISSDGANNAIVWDIDRGTSQLRAYTADFAGDDNGYGTELWTSAMNKSGADALGTAVKFTVPTVANGHVYVGTAGALVVYGPPVAASTAPPAPTQLTATADSGIQITLNWQDNSNNESGFHIQISTDGGKTYSSLPDAGVNAETYTVTNLTVSTTYTFRVQAFNNVGTSAYTNTISATTLALPPAVDFSSGFVNATSAMTLNGKAKVSGTALELTDGGSNEAASAFTTNAQSIAKFSTSFTFQLTNPTADGMAFVIQNKAATAIGADGLGLGYQGITPSVAIKFDLYSNAGEGNNSTGLYTNGVAPTVPATTLPTAVNLHSGDVFSVHMTYDGTTLTCTIIDTKTNASATYTYTVNLVSILGGSNAYVGFTGGTGGSAAVQEILTWSFAPTPTTAPAAASNLQLTAASGTEIDLTWNDNSNNEAGFKIMQSTDGKTYTEIGSVGANVTSYPSTGLQQNTLYYYEVVATNGAGDAAPSAPASLLTPVPPVTPTNAMATVLKPYEITLVWQNNATNDTGYKVLREAANETEFVQIGNLPANSTTFDDLTVLPGVEYDYHIQSFNNAGYSDFAGISVTTPLAPPTTVTAAGSNGSVSLNWTAIGSAASYNVYRSLTPGGEGTNPYKTGITGTSFTDTGLTNGTKYYYTVTSLNSITPESPQSTEVSAVPTVSTGAPTAVKVVANNNGTATLTWTAVPGATSYNIYRGTTTGQEAATAYATATSATFTDANLTSLVTKYFYNVTAVTTNESAKSAEVSVTPQYIAHVNFTAAGGQAVPGYVNDTGEKYPAALGGYTMGWNINNTANGRDRLAANAPDELHDSLIHLDKQTPSAQWTIALPNGLYSVHILAGDPSNFNSVYNIGANGIRVVSGTPTATHLWFAGSAQIMVSNGTMVVTDAAGGVNAKIDSIDISSVATPTAPKIVAGNNSLALTWPAVPGALSYNVYRGAVTTYEGITPYKNVTTNSFTDTNVVNGTTYYYYVSAVTTAGESTVSNEAWSTPKAVVPASQIATPAAETIITGSTSMFDSLFKKDGILSLPLN
jgi:fibronectin type 3 domain-containing protein